MRNGRWRGRRLLQPASALLTISPRRPVMDTEQLVGAIPAVNNFSTVASIVCVLPTYFLRLQPATYRLVLSLGIVFGLSILATAMAAVFWPLPHQISRDAVIFAVVLFSPLVVVLIAILARIRRVSRVGLWRHGRSGLRHPRLGWNLWAYTCSWVVVSPG
jgi:hypothetical protein